MEETKPIYNLRDKFRDCIMEFLNENEGVEISRAEAHVAVYGAFDDLENSGYIEKSE